MATNNIILHIFCLMHNSLSTTPKHSKAYLYL